MKKYIITIVTLFAIILLSIGGYFLYSNAKTKESSSTTTLQAKCMEEINYLSTEIIEMLNELNNISFSDFEIQNKTIEAEASGNETASENSIDTSVMQFDNILTSDNNDINWEDLKGRVENMYSTWTTVLIDLTTLNVNRDNLLKYNSLLDDIVLEMEKEDKKQTLIKLADLYQLLAQYVNDVSQDSTVKSIFATKSNVLYAYAMVGNEDWNKVREYVSTAKQEFSNNLTNPVENMANFDSMNKAYILLNELAEDSNREEEKIFYINYRSLIQELETMTA